MKSIIRICLFLAALFFLTNAAVSHPPEAAAQERPPVLAFYYAWFDQNTWTSGQSTDLPAEPYNSANRAVIERQVAQAQGAGINAFVQSWYGPQEANNQTETNFRMLLDVAAATGFRAAVDVEVAGPFFGDIGAVTNALSTLLATHAQHPAYFRHHGKPVIFFWRQERFSVDQWAAIRNQVDPDRASYWIAEGTDLAYQSIFDGHHLYNIAWAGSPADQLAKWGERVRAYESANQVDRLWAATAMPGYNDTRLPRANTSVTPRRSGEYYRETWHGAVGSRPDMIIITSFNEWLEGTQIEPSAGYGNFYLDVTRELVSSLGGSPPVQPPVAPAALPAAQEDPPEETNPEDPPAGPHIRVAGLVNVRSGPSTDFDPIGQLTAGDAAPVTGRTESGAWWRIDFETGSEDAAWVADEVVAFFGDRSEVPVVVGPEAAPSGSEAPESEDQVDQVDDESPEDLPTIESPTAGVNVRSGPGFGFDRLGRLAGETTAPVTAQDESGDWWQIAYEAGEDGLGWVRASVVDLDGDAGSVPVINFPIEADVLLTATPTPRLTPTPTASPTSTSSPTSTASPTPTPSPTLVPSPTPTPLVVAGQGEVTDAINVRAEPSLDSELVGGLYLGDRVNVYAVSEDGDWWQVEFPDGPDGLAWVAVEFIRFSGDENQVPIVGLGTPTPTPGPTNTPTPTQAAPTLLKSPPTLAPTATSIYQGTAAALLEKRGTPDASLSEAPAIEERPSAFGWSNLPWGILSVLLVGGFFWYQWRRREEINN